MKTYANCIYYLNGEWDIVAYSSYEEMEESYFKLKHCYLFNGKEISCVSFDIYK